MERVFLDFTVHFIIQSDKGKSGIYLLLGSAVRFGLAYQEAGEKLFTRNFDFTGDIGLGLEFKGKNYCMVSELTYSRGLII